MAYLTPEIAALAGRFHGLLRRRELLAMGISRHRIDGWVKTGVLEVVAHGVYRVAGTPETRRQRLLTAVWRVGDDALAADESALGLWQVEGFGLSGRLAVAVRPGRQVRNPPCRIVHTDVDPRDRRDRFGIPSMSPARGVFGVADRVPEKKVRVAIDDVVRRRLHRIDQIQHRAQDLHDLPGAGVVERMITAGTFEMESEGERVMAGLFRPGDPQPVWQVWVLPGIRVDAAFLAARVVLEYDSRAWHLTPTQQDRDGTRYLALRAAEIEPIPVTAGMLRDRAEQTRQDILTVVHRPLRRNLDPLVPLRG
jgi:hypothetical protein